MLRRPFDKGELLLLLLKLLEEGPMSEREIVLESERLLGRSYRVTTGGVLIGLAALEAEALVEVESNPGSAVFRLTESGRQALGRRANAPVLTEADAPRGRRPSRP